MKNLQHHLLAAAVLFTSMTAWCREPDLLPGLPGSFTWLQAGSVAPDLGAGKNLHAGPGSILFLPYHAEMLHPEELAPYLLPDAGEKRMLVVRNPGEPHVLPPTGRMANVAIKVIETTWERFPCSPAAMDSYDCVVAMSPGGNEAAARTIDGYLAAGGKGIVSLSVARSLFAGLPEHMLPADQFTSAAADDEGNIAAWEGRYPGGLGRIFMVDTPRFEEPAAADIASRVESGLADFISGGPPRTIVPAVKGRLDPELYDAVLPLAGSKDARGTLYPLAVLTLLLLAVSGLSGHAARRGHVTALAIQAGVITAIILLLVKPWPADVHRITVLKMRGGRNEPHITQIETLAMIVPRHGSRSVEITAPMPLRPLAYSSAEILDTGYTCDFTGAGSRLQLDIFENSPLLVYACGPWPGPGITAEMLGRLRPMEKPPCIRTSPDKTITGEIFGRLPTDCIVYEAPDFEFKEDIVSVIISGKPTGTCTNTVMCVFPQP
ncbi:MAG: hypothetical protein JW909_01575 [Planctomycetes bacterium]|nr:hypothetical protein [Planctomycetota bacterium]